MNTFKAGDFDLYFKGGSESNEPSNPLSLQATPVNKPGSLSLEVVGDGGCLLYTSPSPRD